MIAMLDHTLYYPIVVVLGVSLLMRRRGGEKKRLAIVAWGALLVALRACVWLFLRLGIPDVMFVVPLIASVAFVWAMRGLFLPFRLRCASCRAPLALAQLIGSDDALCSRCACSAPGQEQGCA